MNNYTNISDLDCIICGLAFTSRTETLEGYLKNRVKSLTVIALSSCFLRKNLSFCRIYEKGILKTEVKIPNFRIRDYKWYRQPLILLVFFVNWLSISCTFLKFKRKFDLYIGISHSFALIGAILKKMRIIRYFIYYCIDYYIPQNKMNFNSLFVRIINIIDRFIVRNSNFVWEISINISEYREKIGGIKRNTYRDVVVPLSYSAHLKRFKSLEEIYRNDIGFVGTITANQGLQLLIEVMPEILEKIPQAKVKIVGEGPFLKELRKMVSQRRLDEHFTFYGFIKEEDVMLDIISRCAIGVALYNDLEDNRNIICADPGKMKLYALCGLPIIVTGNSNINEIIQNNRAGLVIDYKKDKLRDAILYFLNNEERLKEFKLSSFKLGESYISDNIFSKAFKLMFNIYDTFNPKVIRYILEDIKEKDNILDIGCGTGRLGMALKTEMHCFITGIEVDKETASFAKEVYDEVIIMDLNKLADKTLKFESSKKYNYIVFGDILEHFSNPKFLLEHFRAFLKEDGFIIVSIPNVANCMIRLRLLFGNFDYSGGILDEGHLRFFTYKTAKKLLEDSGYKIISSVNNNSTILCSILGKYWKNMFAFQFVFKCVKK